MSPGYKSQINAVIFHYKQDSSAVSLERFVSTLLFASPFISESDISEVMETKTVNLLGGSALSKGQNI